MIHKTSVIETDQIGRNARVMEFAVIRSGARIGEGCVIHSHVVINEGVAVADGVEILPGALIGVKSGRTEACPGPGGRLVIGARCLIGCHAVIFDGAHIGEAVHIGEGAIIGEQSRIGLRCVIGAGARVLSGTAVGEGAVIGAGVVVSGDVPPGAVLSLAQARPLRQIQGVMIHELAVVESDRIGRGTRIWAHTHILPGAAIGDECNICDQVFIENDVVIGDRVTVKSGVHIWDGVHIEDDVFVGPCVAFTNDLFPRSKQYHDEFLRTRIKRGASLGANSTILPGITVGEKAMVGAGAVVVRDVPAGALVVGNPARFVRSLGAGV